LLNCNAAKETRLRQIVPAPGAERPSHAAVRSRSSTAAAVLSRTFVRLPLLAFNGVRKEMGAGVKADAARAGAGRFQKSGQLLASCALP
jgi:hypothetical protein